MTLDGLEILRLDETSRKKNPNYITLFVDLVKKKTVHIAEDKDDTTVVDFIKVLKERGGNPDHITDVSSEMSSAFIKGGKENLPNVEITFDKFHILKIIAYSIS